MSHLSILPTVLMDECLLAQALADLDLPVSMGGTLKGFADDQQAVTLHTRLPEGQPLGWARQADGSLSLVADLQRLGRSRSLQQLLGRITRRYAALAALQTVRRELPDAVVELVR